jgi:integrase
MNRLLVKAAYAETTVTRYEGAVRTFLKWCKNNGAPECHTTRELDELLTEFLHFLFLNNGSKQTGNNVIYGLMMKSPNLKGRLPLSRLAMRGWDKLQPAVAYPPLTWPITVAIAARMAQRGNVLQAIATVVSFHCLLRVGEMTQLKRQDVALADDARLGVDGFAGALRLRKTKTGKNQWVTVLDKDILALLELACRDLQPNDRVFPFSAGSFRRELRAACLDIGITTPYVPHSLRHGGATRLHMQGMRVEDIMLRGRWQSSKSARHYIQSGQALLLSISTPDHVLACGKTLANSLIASLELAYASAQSGHGRGAL